MNFKLLGTGLAALTILATTFTAQAADIPRPVYKGVRPVVAYYNWTGFYLGINGGYGWGRSDWSAFGFDTDPSGGLVGGTIGYNWQAMGSPWVFGLEGDIDWTNIKGTFTDINCPTGCQTKNNWLGTARGRIGYAWDRLMIYATGGAAFTNVTVGSNFIVFGIFPATLASDSKTLVGATVGGGFEYAFTNNFSAGIEGRYSWYGSQTYNAGLVATVFTPGAGGGNFTFAQATQTYKLDTFEVMGKLNFKIF